MDAGYDLQHDWAPYALDPLRFALEVLAWEPDAKQREALENARMKRMIFNWGRQAGKTTLAAAIIVHHAVTRPRGLTVILGGVDSNVAEIFERIDYFLSVIGWTSRGQTGKRISRRLPNQSRIVGTTTNPSVRGHSATLVVLDEAGLIKETVWDAVLPTMAVTDGSLIVASTPYGNSGRFYEVWRGTENNAASATTAANPWFRSIYPATENPRIKPAFLDEMRALKGENFVRQEFLCEFLDNGKTLLSRKLVDNLYRLS
jgi:hypothetical protein